MMQHMYGSLTQQLTWQLLIDQYERAPGYADPWVIWDKNKDCDLREALPWWCFRGALNELHELNIVERIEADPQQQLGPHDPAMRPSVNRGLYRLRDVCYPTDPGYQTDHFSDADLIWICRQVTDELTLAKLRVVDLRNYPDYVSEKMRQKLLEIRTLEEQEWSPERRELEARLRS
jgi:hypothetical protein